MVRRGMDYTYDRTAGYGLSTKDAKTIRDLVKKVTDALSKVEVKAGETQAEVIQAMGALSEAMKACKVVQDKLGDLHGKFDPSKRM
jgi:hypothetical protein